MTINLDYETDIKLDFDYNSVIDLCIASALDYEGCPYESELSVVLTDNASIHETNKEFRRIDSPTDVLSFPMVDFTAPSEFDWLEAEDEYFNPETGELLLGDIMISVERVISQAKEYGHSERRELGFLIVHSMLHLLGYDHMEEEERLHMEEKQKEILEGIGILR